MQTNQKKRPSQVQTPVGRGAYSSYKRADNRLTFIILAVLCLLIPPVGILLTWRAQNIDLRARVGFCGTGFLATILIFYLLMKPSAAVSAITPVPATPKTVGYGAAVVATEPPAQAPAQPADVAPAVPSATEPLSATQEPGVLSDDTIVYAVTNNASSYHLYQICDTQENRRALTLREALSEGLQPCEKCVGAKG